ncbi:hypothetical protein IVG45_05535 [Methylomonas sp. LL1]|uniref:hypothetical protein n=1 Tax=Methylomonas sp. LL1 TaxID=2785785 RepID=UPI0018C40C7E|nr:hypothetical protein [Methylomonas sp. LL1]QPK64428.1 hypothetical protein IVG45_05535 [Methylomonas sp. LL1]CAG1020232.1 hypothetical protein MTYM_00138 [Methylococcales bacterium]
MRPSHWICFLSIFCLLSSAGHAASNAQFEPGDVVLTNCHQIYTKGSVKAKVDDGYTIHFPKNSGPINCPPFRWHAEFVLPYQSVPEYRLQFMGGFKKDLIFRTGETVTLRFDADKRIIKNKETVDIQAEITDISSNGAIAVKLLSNSPEEAATFWKWVGGNYIDLRHKALEAERSKR